MDATDSSKDDSSSSQEQPSELSETDSFLLNIVTKDPDKDLKDESNKTTDSPKRVKLIRPEFDKEKLAQKIREIEEREKQKQKLKEQEEAAKIEEKSGESSSVNKTDGDDVKGVEEPETSEVVVESEVVEEDTVLEPVDEESVVSSGKVDETVVTSVEVSTSDPKKHDKIVESCMKTTPADALGKKMDVGNLKADGSGKEKIIESKVSSTADESVMKKLEKEVLEQKKVESETSVPEKVGTSKAEGTEKAEKIASDAKNVSSSNEQQKMVEETGGEKVVGRNIDSAKALGESSKATGAEKKKEDPVIGGVKEKELVGGGNSKGEIRNLEEKLKVEGSESVELQLEQFMTGDESLSNEESPAENTEKAVESVQQSIESVFDELTVEPSKTIQKVGQDKKSKVVSRLKHVDESSNKSDDILLEIEKFIDSSADCENLKDSSSKVGSSVPTSSKRKLDDDVVDDDAKKRCTSATIDSIKTVEKDVDESDKFLSDELSMDVSDSELEATDIDNKNETDDKSSSKDETPKETPPLETILDSIIADEPETADLPEEDLVVSDIPSTALVETKIPESPRRVKLVRPSKPATKTLTKPEVSQKVSQVKPKVVSESKDVSVKPSTEKLHEVQEKEETKKPERDVAPEEPTKQVEEDTKKSDEGGTTIVNVPQTVDEPVEAETKLNDQNKPATDEKIVTSKDVEPDESSVKVEATTTKLPSVEKSTTEKIIPPVVETSSVKPEVKSEKPPVVKAQESMKLPESVEKSVINQPEEEVRSTKEPAKDDSSKTLPLEPSLPQPEVKVIVEKLKDSKSTEPVPISSKIAEKKPDAEGTVSEKCVATSKLVTSGEVDPVEIPAAQVDKSKVTSSEEVASKEPLVLKESAEVREVSKAPENIEATKSTSEKPSPPVESEASRLRRVIRKPRVVLPVVSKQGETVSSTVVEKKEDVSSSLKQRCEVETVVKKASQDSDLVLDMTVDEEEEEDDDEEEEEKDVVSSSETKQLGFKLKIGKSSSTIIPKDDKTTPQSSASSILADKLISQKTTEHTFGSITISATSSKNKTDMKKVEEMLKDTDVTITPLVDRESVQQKLSKITLKIGKDGNPPEIKQTVERESKGSPGVVAAKRKGGDGGGSPSKKKMKDESAVLTTSSGVEIDLHMKKPKLLSSLIAEPPKTSQDPRQVFGGLTPQQFIVLNPQQQQAIIEQMMNSHQQMLAGQIPQQTPQQMMGQLTPQQFLGTPQSFPGSPVTPGGSEPVKKKRGRPRKIPLPEGQGQLPHGQLPQGQLPQGQLLQGQPSQMLQDPQVQALKQQVMSQSQQSSSGTGTSSGSDEYSSGVFPQVPLFDMTESLFDQAHLFPNQVNAMQTAGRPQRSCRGRIKLPSVRSRKPRGSTMAARAAGTGRGRGRGYKRVQQEFTESDNIITLENVKEEMRRQSMEQAQFLASNEAMQTSQDTSTSSPASAADPGLMKSPPEKKPRKRRTEEQERARIEKMKQKREEKKMKTLEKKRKIAEAKAKEKAAVMAAALVEEETRMSAPERKEEEKKKEIKVEEEEEEEVEKKVEVIIIIFYSSNNTVDTVEPSSPFVTPRKEKKIYRCLICREESPLKKLTSPLDHRSWRVLYQAAIVRGHEEIINLTQNLSDSIPTGILYHRNCRSEFTHKKTLAKLTDCPLPEDGHQISHHHQSSPIIKSTGAENVNPNTPKEVRMVEGTITEYEWPLQGGELYMIQEQVSDFLEITSFKRKYPDIFRRTVETEEKAYLRENGLVSEAHCDLGLIAVKSSDILDIMFADFQDKYEEFRKQIRDKQARELSSKHKAAFTSLLQDKRKFENRVLDAKTEAMQAVAAWNSRLNRTRQETRRSVLDLQSCIVHYPRSVGLKRSQSGVNEPPRKVGHYPVVMVAGQFCDNYKRYTPNELKYFPLNTVIYGPMKPNQRFGGGSDGSQSDSDDSSSSDDSSDSSSDSSDADSDASGDESRDSKDATAAAGGAATNGETHCKMCGGDKTRNKQDNPEVLINCAQCTKSSQLLPFNHRLPTVLLSNISNVRTPVKVTNSSSLSKLLGASPSSAKRIKTENGGADTPKSGGFRGNNGSDSTPKPGLVRGKTEVSGMDPSLPKPGVARVLGTQMARVQGKLQEVQGVKVLGSQRVGFLGKTQGTSRVGTQVVKPVGTSGLGTQIVKPVRTQIVKSVGTSGVGTQIVEPQGPTVLGTQIVKPQEVPSTNVLGTHILKPQEESQTQSGSNTVGSQMVKPQEETGINEQITQESSQSINVLGTPVEKPQEVTNMDVQGVGNEVLKTEEMSEVLGTNGAKPEEHSSGEAQGLIVDELSSDAQEIRKPDEAETVEAIQSILGESQGVVSQDVESMEVDESEAQSDEAQESQKVEESEMVVDQETPSVDQGSQNVETQETSSGKVQETDENPSIDNQRVDVEETLAVKVDETQNIEVQGSQNVDSQQTKPLSEQIVSSESDTLQSNTVSSGSTVDSVDGVDTVSSTVEN
ncbi:titin [Nilaparvata lugens]|uniref:titin n=1 Tax=Nilaparvata lugens TaxID=108931 RepID=UPI00193E8714|nr:titin [Nilaparvata lugens]